MADSGNPRGIYCYGAGRSLFRVHEETNLFTVLNGERRIYSFLPERTLTFLA
jgi:hypothetical protein